MAAVTEVAVTNGVFVNSAPGQPHPHKSLRGNEVFREGGGRPQPIYVRGRIKVTVTRRPHLLVPPHNGNNDRSPC